MEDDGEWFRFELPAQGLFHRTHSEYNMALLRHMRGFGQCQGIDGFCSGLFQDFGAFVERGSGIEEVIH